MIWLMHASLRLALAFTRALRTTLKVKCGLGVENPAPAEGGRVHVWDMAARHARCEDGSTTVHLQV